MALVGNIFSAGATRSRAGLRQARRYRPQPQSLRRFLHHLEGRGPGYPDTPASQSRIQKNRNNRIYRPFSVTVALFWTAAPASNPLTFMYLRDTIRMSTMRLVLKDL